MATSYPIDQALLARVSPWSKGVVALAAPSTNDLDFAAAGLPEVWLGAVGHQTYGGTITPYGGFIGLTGVYGGIELTRQNALGTATLVHLGVPYASGSTLSGSVVLSGDNTLAGDIVVNSRTAELRQSTLSCRDVTVKPSGTLQLTSAILQGRTVTVEQGAILKGCGTIDAEVINHGSIVVDCGDLRFTGPVTNHGHVRMAGNSTFTATSSFVNNGILDLLTSPDAAVPPGLVNNGMIAAFGQVNLRISRKNVDTCSVRFQSLAGRRYQLQRATSPAPVEWLNVGTVAYGYTGGDLGIDDAVNGLASAFYRVLVDP